MHPLRIVYESLRDCVIGFALIVAGFAVAVWLAGSFGASWFTVCLAIAMLPFAWFAKKRSDVKFTWWDYLAWAAFLVVFIGVSSALDQKWNRWGHAAFAGVSFGCFGWIYQTIRRRLMPKSGAPDSHG
jgi:hypothetical protein